MKIEQCTFEVEQVDALCDAFDIDYEVYYGNDNSSLPHDVIEKILDLQRYVAEMAADKRLLRTTIAAMADDGIAKDERIKELKIRCSVAEANARIVAV